MTMAGAVSKRRRFRYPKELRRYKQAAKWQTVAVPKAAIITGMNMLAGGLQKILMDQYSGWNKGTAAPVVEWSVNGTSGWTAVAVTGWTAGSSVITTATVAAGVKYFRVTLANTFGTGPVSNVFGPVTVLA
jgi:hypothetical protein